MSEPRVRSRSVSGPHTTSKAALDALYDAFNRHASAPDPVQLVHRYRAPADIEVAAFCAAVLAFGRVAAVMRVLDDLFEILGPSPAAFVRCFDPVRDGPAARAVQHRWIRGDDVVRLLWVMRRIIEEAGSIEQFFLQGYRSSDGDIGPALDRFSTRARAIGLAVRGVAASDMRAVAYCFPRPRDGSACKRLNLFLRWMVRRDRIDFGIWRGVDPGALVIPLDTHVVRVGRCLGLTSYRSPGWPMARQITQALRRVDARDPVKYDFALCHLGMQNACGFNTPARDARCPLRGVCRPDGRRPRRSRRPSDRP